ncbi:hypothetical protein [Burkholderia ubonensis]|uniref:hypothetical protein n=1 Tax=Burkholderia ubonensis TaxID=101571 RepID=UPI002AB0484F|nr:hypothetical protein [Burkholderia ubonensis]
MLPLLVLAMFAVGAGRCALFTAPIATGVAIFHDKLFASVDVSQSTGLYGGAAPLALLAQMPWTLFAVLSWLTVLMWVLSRVFGMRSVLVEGFLFKG